MIKNDHGKQDFYNYQAIARKQDNPIKVMHEADRRKDRLNYLLGNWLPSDKNAIILEVACGAGVLMTWMKKLGYGQISGVDISEEQTAIAKQCGLAVVTEEALAFLAKCDDDHYDAIFALDFYEHLTPDQFVQFLAVANKKLKTKGILVLRGPNGDSPMLGAAF